MDRPAHRMRKMSAVTSGRTTSSPTTIAPATQPMTRAPRRTRDDGYPRPGFESAAQPAAMSSTPPNANPTPVASLQRGPEANTEKTCVTSGRGKGEAHRHGQREPGDPTGANPHHPSGDRKGEDQRDPERGRVRPREGKVEQVGNGDENEPDEE